MSPARHGGERVGLGRARTRDRTRVRLARSFVDDGSWRRPGPHDWFAMLCVVSNVHGWASMRFAIHVQFWLIAMALVAIAAYSMFSRRQASARVQKQGSSPFLGQFPMEVAYWLLAPIGRLAVTLRLPPALFSWACLVVGLASGMAAGLGAVPAAGGLYIVSALFDAVDGLVARSRGIASAAGEVLDSAIDRYAEFAFLAGLCVYYRGTLWAMVLVQAAVLGSLLVSYSQAKAEAMQVQIPHGWMRRPERAAYLGGGAVLSPIVTAWWEAGNPEPLHYPVLAAVALVAVFANATAIRRFVVLYRTLAADRRP